MGHANKVKNELYRLFVSVVALRWLRVHGKENQSGMENAEGSLFCEITDVGEVALKSLDFIFLMYPARQL